MCLYVIFNAMELAQPGNTFYWVISKFTGLRDFGGFSMDVILFVSQR
jgi:hypothetical protein